MGFATVWRKTCFFYCSGIYTLVFGDDLLIMVFSFYWFGGPSVDGVFGLFVEVCI